MYLISMQVKTLSNVIAIGPDMQEARTKTEQAKNLNISKNV